MKIILICTLLQKKKKLKRQNTGIFLKTLKLVRLCCHTKIKPIVDTELMKVFCNCSGKQSW